MGISTYSLSLAGFFVMLTAAGVRTNCLSTVLLRVVYLGLPE